MRKQEAGIIGVSSEFIEEFYNLYYKDSGLTLADVRLMCKSPFKMIKDLLKTPYIDEIRLEGFGSIQISDRCIEKYIDEGIRSYAERLHIDFKEIEKVEAHAKEYFKNRKKFGEKSPYYTRKCDRVPEGEY